MSDKTEFNKLVAEGNPTGEVTSANRFLVTVEGLEGAPVGSLVLFENGDAGTIFLVKAEYALVLNLSSENMGVGLLGVIKTDSMTVGVSKDLIGRVVNPLAKPVDGKGLITKTTPQPLFADPPVFSERDILNEQLESGVGMVDTLFPVVLGQRIAMLGDSKSGKTTFLTQLVINQAKKGRLIVYVLIGKRKADIELLLARLERNKARKRVILVVADVFDSLPMTYLAPYAGCAIAEYFWHGGEDVVIVYDDLSNHAKSYRELGLTLRINPGRESYPGDMFHAHSSLLERAGRLNTNKKSLTSLPIAVSPNDDITGYLSTSLISITDGQIIFDIETMRQDIKPAINVGLSVSRVGGRSQSEQFRAMATKVSQKLAAYRSVRDLNRFSSEQSEDAIKTILLGERIYSVFKQKPDELYSLAEQQLMLEVVLGSEGLETLDIEWLKKTARTKAKGVTDGAKVTAEANKILASLGKPKEEPAPAPAAAEAAPKDAKPEEVAK